jgi:hypothetical protein
MGTKSLQHRPMENTEISFDRQPRQSHC